MIPTSHTIRPLWHDHKISLVAVIIAVMSGRTDFSKSARKDVRGGGVPAGTYIQPRLICLQAGSRVYIGGSIHERPSVVLLILWRCRSGTVAGNDDGLRRRPHGPAFLVMSGSK